MVVTGLMPDLPALDGKHFHRIGRYSNSQECLHFQGVMSASARWKMREKFHGQETGIPPPKDSVLCRYL